MTGRVVTMPMASTMDPTMEFMHTVIVHCRKQWRKDMKTFKSVHYYYS
jgi:hypothetical protein